MAELKNRDNVEGRFRRRLSRLNRRQRQRLQRHLGDPPSLANVPERFWQRLDNELQDELEEFLFLIYLFAVAQHGADEDAGRRRGRLFASARASRTSSGFIKTSKQLVSAKSRQDKTPAQIATEVLSAKRAAQIAVNETTLAQTRGAEFAVEKTVGLDEDDTWFTRNDNRVCPICEPLHRNRRSSWSSKFPDGPPAHVGCRCWIHYANERRGGRVIGA